MKSRQKLSGVKAVTQKHGYGCAVSCVAFRISKSYSHAHKLYLKKDLAWLRGYYLKEVTQALAKANFHYEYRKYKSKYKELLKQEGTIVFINPNKKYPSGHYLIRTSKGWMNSWINCPMISPVKSGFQRKLPGEVQFVLFEK